MQNISLSQLNIYEVNIRQYTLEGTFRAFSNHLERLKTMGVQMLWLMPITPISLKARQGSLGSYYACSSYTKINPEFGTLEDFIDIVNQIHALGMQVIIDWVANHTGCDHEWTIHHPEWYVRDEMGNFTERNGWKDVIDLNYDNELLQQAMIDAMQFWMNTANIDGFRCDMAHLVPLSFWKRAKLTLEKQKPLFWLAETDDAAYHEVFDVSYAWSWMHLTEQMMQQKCGVLEMVELATKTQLQLVKGTKLYFTANHDENSWNGTEYEKYGPLAKAMAVFTILWNGVPLIYSGQEIPNFKRLAFFDKDTLQWDNEPMLHTFYKTLLNFRLEYIAFKNPDIHVIPHEHDNKVLAFLRTHQQKTCLVIINLSQQNKIQIVVNHQLLNGRFYNLFSGIEFQFTNQVQFEVQSGEWLIYYQ